ncbi:MAG: outer membrane protein assembly factor BamD [Thioalkalispiraceae bacterium]
MIDRVLRLSILGLLIVIGAGCASTSEEDPTEGMQVAEIYEEASAMLKSGDYERAILLYERLESRFPYGKYAERAQMEIAFAYYKDSEPESAIVAAERFIKLHPNHKNVDYMYYLRGLASYDLSESFMENLFNVDPTQHDPQAARRAFEYFAQLIKKYPKSRYSKDALQRMTLIRNNLAQYEVHVANYYIRRGAYLAAANRGKYVVENYQRTPAVADALAIMVNAYEKLGMKELASDTKRVLKLNHPEHESLKK